MRSWMLAALVVGLCGCPEEKKSDAKGDGSAKTESSAKGADSAKAADSAKKEEKKDEGGW